MAEDLDLGESLKKNWPFVRNNLSLKLDGAASDDFDNFQLLQRMEKIQQKEMK